MSKVKVSTLTGPLLDYWVGVADEATDLAQDQSRCYYRQDKTNRVSIYSPSTDWSQGGPIIERETIEISGARGRPKHAQIYRGGHVWVDAEGPTHLIAAMRCYVSFKFGEKVPE